MTHTDPIKALVERIQDYLGSGGFFNPELMDHEKVKILLMDIRDALKPMADVVMVDRRAVLEEAAKVCENTWFGLDVTWWLEATKKDVSAESCRQCAAAIRALIPASPAPVDGELVERVARAIWNVDAHPARKNWDEAIQSDDYADALNDCRAYASAALAAINGEK